MEPKQLTPAQAFENTLTKEAMYNKLSSVMPPHANMNTFISSTIKYCISNPKVMEADRASLYNAIFEAAKAGMLIDGRESFLPIYRGTVEFQTMFRGNAKRAGFDKYGAVLIHEGDEYKCVMGMDGVTFEYTMARKGRGELEMAIGWSIDKDGFKRVLQLPAERVLQIAKKAKDKATAAAKRYGKTPSSPWFDSFDEMAKKHVINVMCKHVYEEPSEYANETIDQQTGEITEINITPAPKPTPQLTAAQIAVQATMEDMADKVLETANEYQQAQNAN